MVNLSFKNHTLNYILFLYFRDLSAELPFVLMHPKPEDDEITLVPTSSPNSNHQGGDGIDVPVDNLIQLDT